ncbi:hypothetical protein, partial [Salinispora arenicola]|uniref:hypothetical protein n=1 Tax=Salinispora arenicola TaxID=168697 RepID=UPI0027DCE550
MFEAFRVGGVARVVRGGARWRVGKVVRHVHERGAGCGWVLLGARVVGNRRGRWVIPGGRASVGLGPGGGHLGVARWGCSRLPHAVMPGITAWLVGRFPGGGDSDHRHHTRY